MGGGYPPQPPPWPARPAGRPATAAFWRPGRRLAAALVLVAAGLAAFLVFRPPSARATPNLLEQLVEWNVDLAEARTQDERSRILTDQEEQLKTTLAEAALPPADRDLAESLLENGAWLVQNSDPVAEADRFGDLADKLLARMDSATAAHDEQLVVLLAKSYDRLTTAGIEANLKRAGTAGATDGKRHKKLTHCQQRHARRTCRAAEIIDRNPEPYRKAIHRHLKKK